MCHVVLCMTDNAALDPAPATLETPQFIRPSNRDLQSDDNNNIVLHVARDAKTKLANAKVARELVVAMMAVGPKKPALKSALVDWVCSEDTGKTIARRHSIHQSLLSYWSKRLGLPMRRRGRRSLPHPTAEHRRILELVRMHGVTHAATRAGVSKQRVFHIICRWAPQLKGRRRALTVSTPPKRKRPRRNVVVSFRISADEWQQLLAAAPISGDANLSGFKKARAIVLKAIAPSDGDGGEAAQGSATTGDEGIEVVNVFNRRAA